MTMKKIIIEMAHDASAQQSTKFGKHSFHAGLRLSETSPLVIAAAKQAETPFEREELGACVVFCGITDAKQKAAEDAFVRMLKLREAAYKAYRKSLTKDEDLDLFLGIARDRAMRAEWAYDKAHEAANDLHGITAAAADALGYLSNEAEGTWADDATMPIFEETDITDVCEALVQAIKEAIFVEVKGKEIRTLQGDFEAIKKMVSKSIGVTAHSQLPKDIKKGVLKGLHKTSHPSGLRKLFGAYKTFVEK